MRNAAPAVRVSQFDTVDIVLGHLSDDQARNIVRECKDRWRYLDKVKPAAEIQATRDTFGQVHIKINGQALKYLFLFLQDWKEFKLEPREPSAPMPDDFAI